MENTGVRPGVEVFKQKIADERGESSVLKEGTNRISYRGKKIAASIFSFALEQGKTPQEIREDVQTLRKELKTSISDRKKQLTLEIREELALQGLKQKGHSTEFRFLVREQLAARMQQDTISQSASQTRKLLSSINQRARILQSKQPVPQSVEEIRPVETEVMIIPPLEPLQPNELEIVEEANNIQADLLTSKAEELTDTYSQRAQVKAGRIGWPRPVKKLILTAASFFIALTVAGYTHKTHTMEAALPETNYTQTTNQVHIEALNSPSVQFLNNENTENPQPHLKTEDFRTKTDTQMKQTALQLKEIADKYKSKNIDLAFSVKDVKTGESVLSLNADKVDTAASTAKIYTGAAILDASSKNLINLDQKIGSQTIRNLLRLMLNQSDNSAWKTLYNYLGKDKVENFAKAHGASNFDIDTNKTSPDDLATFFANLYSGKMLPDRQRDLMLSYMKGGTTSLETILTPGMMSSADNKFFHKWGLYGNVVGDTGVVDINGHAYSIAVMAWGKTFMDGNYAVTDGTAITNRFKALSAVGPIIANGLSKVSQKAG